MRERKPEPKPLLFTTTLRNPSRIKDFLSVLYPYNGKVLTKEVINKVVLDLVSKKLYVPVYANKVPLIKRQLKSDIPLSTSTAQRIINNSPQDHKEAGFDKGWPSRFDTWYKFPKELGFVWYEMDKPIEFSKTGILLLDSMKEGLEHLEQQVYLNAFAKYQTNNPFRKNSIENRPLILLLSVLKELKEFYGQSFKGVAYTEIPLFICWLNSDYKALARKIIEIRKAVGFGQSNEYIYDQCKQILNISDDKENRFKISNIINELPDEFIRKMRLTGLITLRGYGRFIDINYQEIEKVDYVLRKYSNNQKFETKRQYFDYMKELDETLVNTQRQLIYSKEEGRDLFLKWVNQFSLETLRKELLILVRKGKEGKSKDPLLKFIVEPLRLEFLTAIIVQKSFSKVLVKPNYQFDDEGVPTSFALGNEPDIVVEDEKGDILIEVTLLTGTTQNIREMPAIARHLLDYIKKIPESFSIMLAPSIHVDTYTFSHFESFKNNINIYPISVSDFIDKIQGISNLRDISGEIAEQ